MRSLLDQITVHHGPRAQLAAFFLQADQAAEARGIRLSLSRDFRELKRINLERRESWHPLAPFFDHENGGIDETNGFWLTGYNDAGEIVTTQVARHFRIAGSLRDEAESLRLFYPVPERQAAPGESCQLDAPSAATICGNVVFSGGGWSHPDYRGRGMFSIMPRISRALALTLWATQWTFSFVDWRLVDKGVAAAYGYRRIERGIRWMFDRDRLRLDGALVLMDRPELLADLEAFPELIGHKGRVKSERSVETLNTSPELQGTMTRR